VLSSIFFSIVHVASPWLKILTYAVLGIIGIVLIKFFERPIVIIGTSTAGAYFTVLGFDVVFNQGIANEHSIDNGTRKEVLYEFAGILALALFGSLFQMAAHKGAFGVGGRKQSDKY